MNLIDPGKTSLLAVLEAVRTELAKLGTRVDYTELVRLMPLLEAGLWDGMDVLR